MKHHSIELTGRTSWIHWCLTAAGLLACLSDGNRLHAEPLASLHGEQSSSSVLLPVSTHLFEVSSDTVTRSLLTPNPHSESPGESATDPASLIPIPSSLSTKLQGDRLWLVDTRRITSNVCRANLRDPNIRFSRLDRCGRRSTSDLSDYLASMSTDRPRIIYIHGNRRDAPTAISQGLWVYREIARNRPSSQPIDWVIWSWPSDAESLYLTDARKKARRTDAQALYLAWLINHHHAHSQPTSLIGFSFGARILTGALHAFAGGNVSGRTLDQPAVAGANFDVGMLAPAVDNTWLSKYGNHRYASQNINRMVLLYNHRDFALKYFRLISQQPQSQALGYTGPRSIAPRYDGTRMPIRARDCANTVGNHHSEKQYYKNACYAGREMASLIESSLIVN